MNKPVMMDEPVVNEPVMVGEVMVHEPVPWRKAGRTRMARHASEALHLMARRKAGRARMARHASEALHLMARRETGCPVTHLGECGRR